MLLVLVITYVSIFFGDAFADFYIILNVNFLNVLNVGCAKGSQKQHFKIAPE